MTREHSMDVDEGHPPAASAHSKYNMDSLPTFPCAKKKLDQIFMHWLVMPDTQDLINRIIDDAKNGNPLKHTNLQPMTSPLSPKAPHMGFSSVPPVSPSRARSPRSPYSPQRRSTAASSTLKKTTFANIPQFYFPKNDPRAVEAQNEAVEQIKVLFKDHPAGVTSKTFVEMAAELCELPRMLLFSLFTKLESGGKVTCDVLSSFWVANNMFNSSTVQQAWVVLKPAGREYLVYADFMPLMDALLTHHPGLEFLVDTPDFQKKYSETVVYRIFYTMNRNCTGRMTFREFKKGDLLDAIHHLDAEDDINKVLRYFSYEHFYVIYCKFWELDTDHDFLIDKNDLAHYSQSALSYQIIDRIFEQAPRRFVCDIPGKMGYEDFVWFILSEEDKSTDASLEYWFAACDLDCDGFIRPSEMWHFYEEQRKRLDTMAAEPVLFEDVMCQLHDMLLPAKEGAYSLQDLRQKKPQSGLLFNALFNLNKFLNWENRDPFQIRAEQQSEVGQLSEWDKFARIEYVRLANEEEPEDTNMTDSY